MQLYTDLIAMPVAQRVAAYANLTPTEKEYCNTKAALLHQKTNLAYHEQGEGLFSDSVTGVIKGAIALLEQDLLNLEIQLQYQINH